MMKGGIGTMVKDEHEWWWKSNSWGQFSPFINFDVI